MSAFSLTHTCTACGAKESLDALLLRMIDDDVVRRLIADVITQSLPLGGQVVSYLRLHKPPKQRLRMAGVARLLAELVPDIRRGAITRKGREWQAPAEAWRAAFAAVFEARDKGTLDLPLDGNAYLYEVLMRHADRAEGAAERATEMERGQAARSRAHAGGPRGLAAALDAIAPGPAAADAAARAPQPSGGWPDQDEERTAAAQAQTQAERRAKPIPFGPSPASLRIQAEIRAKLAARTATATEPAASDAATGAMP